MKKNILQGKCRIELKGAVIFVIEILLLLFLLIIIIKIDY